MIATSKDGTKIAYDVVGDGPIVVLVDGALGVRSSRMSAELARLLAPNFTVYYYDRRGRGDSTDTQPYLVIKEIEDIEAVIDAAGGSAYIYGISSGAALALEAAIKLPTKVKKLALYEAPYDSSPEGVAAWRNYRAKLTELLAADNRSAAIKLFLSFVGVPTEMIETMHRSPAWQPMKAIAPTLAYDAAVLGNDRTVPTHLAAKVVAPTLVLHGSLTPETMPFMRFSAEELTAAIPNAKHQVLEGQKHDVNNTVLAPVLTEFFKQTS